MRPAAPLESAVAPILVVSYGRMGDIMRSLSVVRMIRERHPGRPIDFVARAPADEIARFVPEIRNVYIERTPHKALGLDEKFAFARALRQQGYARAYVLSRAFKAALMPFLAGIGERVGYFGEGRFILVNRLRWGDRDYRHEAHRLCALALEPGEPWPSELPPPRLVVAAAEVEAWRAREGLAADGRPVLAIAPGASYAPRRWPIEHFVEIARRAHARGWAVWVLVDASEAHLAAAIRAAVPTPEFKGNTIADMILKISAANAFLGNESGPLHVAAATGKPCVALLGPTGLDDFAPLNPLIVVEPASTAHAHISRGKLVRSVLDVGIEEVDAAVQRAVTAGM